MSLTHNIIAHCLRMKRATSFATLAALILAFRLAAAAPSEQAQTTPLLNAALAGNISAMKALIDSGANVNEANVYGNTPLHFALRRTSMGRRQGRLDAVALLVTHGANVNSRTRDGRTPLMDASDIGDAGAVLYLVAHGAQLDLADADGRTALAIAASRLYSDIVATLAAHGADTEARDKQGRTPLMQAIAAVSVPMPTRSEDRAAEKNERRAIVNLLLQHRADANSVDKLGWTPVALAADKGSPEIVAALINHGANVDIAVSGMGNQTPLMLAIRRNSPGTVMALIAAKPDFSRVDASGRTALSYARGYQDKEIIDLLQKAGAVR
jgi:ankyrin repeat protein